MASWTITDSQTTELEGFELAWLPDQAYDYLTPRRFTGGARDQVALEAGPYIGVLPLRNGDVLYIAPRVGQETVSRMLLMTGRLEHAVRREFEELSRLSYSTADHASWVFLLARTFAKRLRHIEKSSLRFDREWTGERQWSLQGRVDVPKTLLSVARQESQPIHASFRRKTYATPEHHVLGSAAAALLRQRVVAEEDRAVVARWAACAGDRASLVRELRDVVRQLNADQFAGSRGYYITALVMAQLILLQSGIVLSDERAIESEALLTNVYTLYEAYVRITTRNHLADRGYVVEKLETGARTLFLDGTAELKPDVIVSDRHGVRLLMDAKYKPGSRIDASDYYQMAAYLRAYRTGHGIIVRAGMAGTVSARIVRHMVDGGVIHELTIDLNDWGTAESGLLEAVNQVLEDAAPA